MSLIKTNGQSNMRLKKASLVFACVSFVGCLLGLSSGDRAPDFKASNQDGKMVHLSSLTGKPILIYFYPKDDTPGCTKEACQFRDEYSKFKKLGAVVLGISTQDSKSHQSFRLKHQLPFDLLVDKDGSIAEKYGIKKTSILGFHFLSRQSVLIGADGKIVKFYSEVNPNTHANEVLADLEKMKKPTA